MQTFLESTILKGAFIMTKTNVWETVNKEAATIIKSIEKGEVKTRKEYCDYLDTLYNWRVSEAITSIVSAYLSINNIEMPWEQTPTETDE